MYNNCKYFTRTTIQRKLTIVERACQLLGFNIQTETTVYKQIDKANLRSSIQIPAFIRTLSDGRKIKVQKHVRRRWK